MYLAECWYSMAETHHRIMLRPRRTDRNNLVVDGGFNQVRARTSRVWHGAR